MNNNDNDSYPTPEAQPRKWPHRLRYGLQVLLAAAFVNFGVGLVTGGGDTELTFEEIGAGQWLRVVCGLLYLSAAIGLLTRWLAGAAALGLVGMMVGAALVEIAVLDDGSPVAPLVLMALLSVVVWSRRLTILALPARLASVVPTNPIRRISKHNGPASVEAGRLVSVTETIANDRLTGEGHDAGCDAVPGQLQRPTG